MFLTLTLLQYCRQLRTLAFGWLLPVLLLTAVHPALMNASQSTGERVMLCTSQGMVWLEVVQPESDWFTEQAQPFGSSDDSTAAWSLCPWCRHAGHWPALPLQAIPLLWLVPPLPQIVPVPVHMWIHAARWDFRLPLARAPPL